MPKTDRTRVGLGSDQGLRGQSPTTNHQSHGTALSVILWRLSAASSQTAINDKGLFFRRCASSVDVLEHAVFRQQRSLGVCYVPEVVDLIYSDALSHKHQRIATDAGRDTAFHSNTTQNVPWNVTMRNLKRGDQRNPLWSLSLR